MGNKQDDIKLSTVKSIAERLTKENQESVSLSEFAFMAFVIEGRVEFFDKIRWLFENEHYPLIECNTEAKS